MICPSCKNECDDNLVFCNYCGYKLKDTDVTKLNEEKKKAKDVAKVDNNDEFSVSANDANREPDYINSINVSNMDEEEKNDKIADEYVNHKKKSYQSSNNKGYKPEKKKMSSKTKMLILILVSLVCMAIASITTYEIVKTQKTEKFNKYFGQGNSFYDSKNYRDARTQYINAANNAVTSEQKIKSYEMVCKVDEFIGDLDEEEIKYYESLVKVDKHNIEYYESLIVLYQNNNHDSKIESLIVSAPSSIREQLKKFDGTIPVPSIEEGTYNQPISIELKAAKGVKIYYTTDGSDPSKSTSRTKYSNPIKFKTEGTFTLRAYSVDKNSKSSKQLSAKYILSFVKVDKPDVTPDGGKYSSPKKIEAAAADNCEIYYTTDGTEPNKKSKKYTKPIKMPKGNTLYIFVAIDKDGVKSPLVSRVYDYSPEYTVSYTEALKRLSEKLVSDGIYENEDGSFKNKSQGYIEFIKISEIKSSNYYIVKCSIEDSDGDEDTKGFYAISSDTGACYKAKKDNDKYKLDE